MKRKSWMLSFLTITTVLLAMNVAANYFVDPFNVFHTKIFKSQFQLNERFAKVEYLEEHHSEFNGYLFGSSRIGTTDPAVLEQYLPNSKIYNFTLSSASLYDYKVHLEYFIQRKYPIDTLYMQIDLDNMRQYGILPSDYLRKIYPKIEGKSLQSFYMEYLTGFFPENIQGTIQMNLKDKVRIFDLARGYTPDVEREAALAQDCQAHVESIPSFKAHYDREVPYTTARPTFKALEDIVALCKKNNIALYIFITPHNQQFMDRFLVVDYLKYLKDISSVTSYYDFSGYNSITTDNCNYYEISHYKAAVAKLIAARIFHDASIDVPSDFGVWVTKDNIDQHLMDLKNSLSERDLRKR